MDGGGVEGNKGTENDGSPRSHEEHEVRQKEADQSLSLRDSTLMMSLLPSRMDFNSFSSGSVLSWMRQQAAAAPSKMMFWTSSMLVLARRIWSMTWARTPTRSK